MSPWQKRLERDREEIRAADARRIEAARGAREERLRLQQKGAPPAVNLEGLRVKHLDIESSTVRRGTFTAVLDAFLADILHDCYTISINRSVDEISAVATNIRVAIDSRSANAKVRAKRGLIYIMRT